MKLGNPGNFVGRDRMLREQPDERRESEQLTDRCAKKFKFLTGGPSKQNKAFSAGFHG
jgi:hypothetical protein